MPLVFLCLKCKVFKVVIREALFVSSPPMANKPHTPQGTSDDHRLACSDEVEISQVSR